MAEPARKRVKTVNGGGPSSQVLPVIIGIATGNPEFIVTQNEALAIAQRAPGHAKVRGILPGVYGNTQIHTRYFAVSDFTPERASDKHPTFFSSDLTFQMPLQDRLEKFKKEAIPLVVDTCNRAIAEAKITTDDIGKLVVVSSTGFFGPGLDCSIIDELKLSRNVDRSLIGFMGCAAGMNGLSVGKDYVACHPDKKALVVCVELSSVHTTFEDTINDAILHAIFADGCAACVLSASTAENAPAGSFAILDNYSELCTGAEDGITLAMKTNGITCTLSKHLSQYIEKSMPGYIDGFLAKHELKFDSIKFWGVHPGGTRIIEAVEKSLGLTKDQTADSWAVLKNYGNMLSPSILYVLKRKWDAAKLEGPIPSDEERLGLCFSFSPGVGIEGALMRQL
jgi:alpha-pyrone synthase